MKSLHIDDAVTPALVEVDMPRPKPDNGEILVRVHSAGIILTELGWYPHTHWKDGSTRTHALPAHEFSGRIEEISGAGDGLSVGQEVYGMNDWFQDGALAEFCLTRPEWVAPKLSRLTHDEAASVPISALTAWQGLFDRAKLSRGERVLVHGGAGAVGTYAVQLAHLHGAYVIATVSPHNSAFVKELGADETIDYKAAPFEQQTDNIDVVFDSAGGDTTQRSLAVLKPGGRLVTITSDHEGSSDPRIKQAFFIVEPGREQLLRVSTLIDEGKLRVIVDAVVPFARASDAYEGKIKKTGRGKIVVSLADLFSSR